MTVLNIPILFDPSPEDIGPTVRDFLHSLSGPCWLVLPGRDRSRSRALATLLHGNEPSGLTAIRRFVAEGSQPAVDCHILIGAVSAAAREPVFSHRVIDGHRDLNRCFRPPYDDSEGKLAKSALDYLENLGPECLLDIHNTSGSGPEFAVTTEDIPSHRVLAQLFTHRLIVTELRMGALMEIATPAMPTITVECGGASDPQAHEVAFDGIQRYFMAEDVFSHADRHSIFEIFREPLRLEFLPDTRLEYGEGPPAQADLCVPSGIENYNFGTVDSHVLLAWLGDRGLECVDVRDLKGCQRRDEFFEARGGALFAREPLRLFMATTRSDIALSDCLFYFVREADVIPDRDYLDMDARPSRV